MRGRLRVAWAREVEAQSLRFTPRPVWKCLACELRGRSPSCPPASPGWREAGEWASHFRRALVVRFEPEEGEPRERFEAEAERWLLEREQELTLSGKLYAFALFPGPCRLCDPCPVLEGRGECPTPHLVRPATCAVGLELDSLVRLDFSERAAYGILLIE